MKPQLFIGLPKGDFGRVRDNASTRPRTPFIAYILQKRIREDGLNRAWIETKDNKPMLNQRSQKNIF